jgi:Tol biopolymer transport system component
MSLAPGTRIGVYEIRDSLGAGGMGEVYRARDTRLNRDVAIKVLPEVLAGDPERLGRLHREAQVLASLNHPNIAIVHGFEEGPADGLAKTGHDIHALVMELVDGPTLADRLASGPIDFDDASRIAKQIADALDAAHAQGVIHRDLKPANIKVRSDGTVKVLDFGLAKMADAPPHGGSYGRTGSANQDPAYAVSQSPTLMSPAMLTGVGVIFGTAAYMSPEQARGKAVDKRADIWAFGCVFYEMLTGKRPFGGSEISDTLASVLKDEPDWTRVPAQARRLLERCLEKDPTRRLRDIGDAMSLLEEGRAQPVAAPAGRRSLWIASAVAIVSLIAVAALALVHFSEETPLPPVVRFQLAPPEKGAFGPAFALSPNGRMLAFIGATDAPQLWVYSFDTGESRPLTAAGNFSNAMFWSPDSRFIAFPIDGKLRRISVAGDQVQTICSLPSAGGFGGGTWGPDDVIVFGLNSNALVKVPASGGTPQPVTKLAGNDIGHVGPTFLPDGKHFLYHRINVRPEERGIYVGSLDVAPESQSTARLLEAESRPVFASGTAPWNRFVLFLRDRALLAQAFDPVTLKTTGDPLTVSDRAGLELSTAVAVSIAADGTLAYRGDAGAMATPLWVNRGGLEAGSIASSLRNPQYPRLSPDGARLALVVDSELWVYDLHGRPPVKLATEGGIYSPLWTPDGARLIYESNFAGALRIIPVASGASSSAASPAGHFHPHGWSPDGKEMMAVHYTGGDTATDIVLMLPEAAAQPHALVRTPAREGVDGATLSPDGRWLAYASNDTGEVEVWVAPYGRTGAPVRVSPRGGVEPIWSKNSRELYYLEGGRMMAVAVEAGNEFNFKPPTFLFEFRYVRSSQPPSYDVAADGRFLVLKPVVMAPPAITVISNWAQNAGKTK